MQIFFNSIYHSAATQRLVESADREEDGETVCMEGQNILGFSTVRRVSPLPKGCSQVNCAYKVKSSSKEFQRIGLRWELLACRALIRECSGDPGGSDSKDSACSAGDQVQPLSLEDPLEKEIPPTLVFLPGECHG